MGKLLDRQMFFSYVKSYLVCMVSLLGLFIVVDLFMNLDDFMHAGKDFPSMVQYVVTYYAYNTLKVFNNISEAIVLLAAMFTVGMMQRNNELLPLLSAGVSTRRVVLPVLIGAICMLGLSVLNQELLLPHVDPFLIEIRGDPNGEREIDNIAGAIDPLGIVITAKKAVKKGMLLKDFICVFTPNQSQQTIKPLQAKEAHYIPPEPGNQHSGGWLLMSASCPNLEGWRRDDLLETIVPGQSFFLHTSPDIDFERVTRLTNWHVYTPTWKLLFELSRDGGKLPGVAVLFHMRLTRPILGMILVFLGLSVILGEQNRNIFISAGLCLLLCGLFFMSCFTCQALGNQESLSPTLAAWLPVLVFGPLAGVMYFDAIHT